MKKLSDPFKKNYFVHIVLIIILFVHVLVLKALLFYPYSELFIYPYLTNHGLKPYQQILDQHFPGLMFLPVNFNNLGMTTPETARIWSVVIVILTQLILFWVSSRIFSSKWKALVVNILYLIWQPFFEGWVFWIDSFLPLFLLPCFYFLYTRKYFPSAIFLGIAIVFKQTIIPLAVILSVYMFFETSLNKTVKFILISLLPLSLSGVYFVFAGILLDFWYWTVIFNLTTYARYGTQLIPPLGYITRIVFVYSASLLILFYKPKRLVVMLLLFIAGSLAGAFDRTDFVHLQPSLPFVVLATSVGVFSLNKFKLIRPIFLIYIVVTFWWLNVFYKGHISNKVLLFDETTRKLAEKIKLNTTAGQKIFILGAVPHLYQMTETLPAGDIFVFQFPWFLLVAEDRVLEGIKSDKPEIVISNREVDIDGQKITEFAKSIDLYIQENYYLIDNVGSTEILQRK